MTLNAEEARFLKWAKASGYDTSRSYCPKRECGVLPRDTAAALNVWLAAKHQAEKYEMDDVARELVRNVRGAVHTRERGFAATAAKIAGTTGNAHLPCLAYRRSELSQRPGTAMQLVGMRTAGEMTILAFSRFNQRTEHDRKN